MKNSPFLSILIPVYNTSPFLKTCIESIIGQTFTDWELILVDDGSTDGSLKICEKYAERFEKILVIHKENGGLVSARKKAMEFARGVYVTYVDSDDWIESEGYKRIYEIAIKTKADIIATPLCVHRMGKVRILDNRMPEGLYENKDKLENLKKNIIFKDEFGSFGIIPSLCGKWFRRDYVREFQMSLKDEVIFGEDAAVSFPALWSADRIYLSPKSFYQYEVRKGSITTTYSEHRYKRIEMLLNYMYNVKKLLTKIPPDFERQLARYRFYLLLGAFESELSLSSWRHVYKSFKNIKEEMKKISPEIFRKAVWQELRMSHCTRYMMKFWEKENYMISFIFVALGKIDKKIKK